MGKGRGEGREGRGWKGREGWEEGPSPGKFLATGLSSVTERCHS